MTNGNSEKQEQKVIHKNKNEVNWQLGQEIAIGSNDFR